MAISTYTPSSTKIVHNTSVDFVTRYINNPVHLVQYDNSTPIIAVKLYSNGTPYAIPSGMNVNVKTKKPDKKVIYNPVLGCDSTRTIVYIEATSQFTAAEGSMYPVVEITDLTVVAASGYFLVDIDANPVNNKDIESSSEAKAVQEWVDVSKSWAVGGTGKRAGEDTNNSKYWSGISANYEAEASTAATNAKTSETKAKTSEINAKTSETNAKTSETNAATSETNANTSETNAADSALEASTSENNAAASALAASTSETNAKDSETTAINKATEAKSYAVGGTGTREGEDTDNARYYYINAKAVTNVDIATLEKPGIVKPDGKTITIDPDGTLHVEDISHLPDAEIDAIFNEVWV